MAFRTSVQGFSNRSITCGEQVVTTHWLQQPTGVLKAVHLFFVGDFDVRLPGPMVVRNLNAVHTRLYVYWYGVFLCR